MATYFNKYYFEFLDEHPVLPAIWRVDIMDSQGATPTQPFLLTMGPQPLILERIRDSENEDTGPIGWQATMQYMYTGDPNIPLPLEFFDAPERRFKVEIRKNGVLEGTFYVRPDGCEYPDQYPPFPVSLVAVDGFSYAKGQLFNIYQESGLLLYDKIQLYEAIMERGLLLILENNPAIRVLQSLYPENIEPGVRMLFGLSVHTDIFYDFVRGAVSVHEVISAFCRSFYANIFTSAGKVWFIRNQDLTGASFTVDEYTSDSSVSPVLVPDFVKIIGPSQALDGVTVKPSAVVMPLPALKRAEFEVPYKGINQVYNFDWSSWDGTAFQYWLNPFGAVVSRDGLGTQDSPFRAFFQAFVTETANEPYLFQTTTSTSGNTFKIGDIVELEARFFFHNTVTFQISVVMASLSGGTDQVLTQGGTWVDFFPNGPADYSHRVVATRSGRKKQGSIQIKSLPLPQKVGDSPILQIYIYAPNRLSYHAPPEPGDIIDGPAPDGIYIYPLKVSVIGTNSLGRHLTAINENDFSLLRDQTEFEFIDTGEGGLSNTIFTGVSLAPAANWDNDKPNVSPADIEKHMAESYIDQATRSPLTWEGNVLSNSIDFHNAIELSYMAGRRFRQMADTYNVKRAEHAMRLREVFEEGNAEIEYTEYDIEEEKD